MFKVRSTSFDSRNASVCLGRTTIGCRPIRTYRPASVHVWTWEQTLSTLQLNYISWNGLHEHRSTTEPNILKMKVEFILASDVKRALHRTQLWTTLSLHPMTTINLHMYSQGKAVAHYQMLRLVKYRVAFQYIEKNSVSANLHTKTTSDSTFAKSVSCSVVQCNSG